MAATKNFPVFDCDSHVVEPPAIWDEYVPARQRAWVKSQFCFHTDSDLLMINGRVVPAARERSNAAEVGWARWSKVEVGKYTPGTEEWQARFGRLYGKEQPWLLPAHHTAPELLFGREQQMLVQGIRRNRDLNPPAAPGDNR